MLLTFLFLTLLVASENATNDELVAATALKQLSETDLRLSKPGTEGYRVVFIPEHALYGPTSIRLDRSGDDWILTTSRFSEPTKRGPSQLLKPKTRKLQTVDVNPTLPTLKAGEFHQMSLDERTDRVCLDGVFWLCERIQDGKYEKTMYYCPATTRFKAFGEALRRLARRDLK